VTIVNGRITLQFLQNAKNAVLIGSLRRRQGRFRSINLHHFGFQLFRSFSVLWLASPSLGLAARPEWSRDDANLGFFFQIPTKGSHIRHGGKQIRKLS
jgi:hypothetical protein